MLNKNKLSFTDIENILDNHIESETDILFVCNYPLAKYICEYLADEYDIVDETMELDSDDIEEYYVSLLFDGEEIQMFCEDARGNSGDYKYCDFCDDYGDYFIFTDMSEKVADVTLEGNASWSWCEMVEDDEVFECQCPDCVEQRRLEQEEMCNCNQCNDCDNCEDDVDEELTDRQKQIVDIVEDFAFKIEHEIENDDLCECGCTLRNMLADMFYQARQIGFEDGIECGVESVKEKTVNIHVDNLTVNGDGKVEDFVSKLGNVGRVSFR